MAEYFIVQAENEPNEWILIDRKVCQDSQRGKPNVSMAWVDVWKAYDSVDHDG